MLPMICNYSLWDPKPCNNMTKEKKCSCLSYVVECRYRFGPFGKIVDCDNNITMPPGWTRVTGHEVNTPFHKWSHKYNRMHWKWWFADPTIKNLARMTTSDHEDAVSKNSRPKVTDAEYLLRGSISSKCPPQAPSWHSFNTFSASSWVRHLLKIVSTTRQQRVSLTIR